MFGAEYDVIPPELDKMEPGPMLGVILLAVEVRKLSGHDQIVVMRAHQRMASHFQARVYDDMTAVVDSMEDDDLMSAAESAAAEIRAALSLTRRTSISPAANASHTLGRRRCKLKANSSSRSVARIIVRGSPVVLRLLARWLILRDSAATRCGGRSRPSRLTVPESVGSVTTRRSLTAYS